MALNKDKVMASAQKLIQQGRLDKAIKELQRLLEEDPKDVRTLLKIGDLYTKKGDRNEATQTYLQVAEFYSEQGFYLKAVAVYKQILRVDPNLVDVNLKLAELYHQLGLMNDSVQQYQLVANVLDRQGRTKESLAIIKKMVDLDPENVASRIKLAEMYSSQQMPPEAVQEFDTACQQLKKQDRLDDYVKVAERLLFHDPGRTDTARDLAHLYLQRGDPKRALAKLQLCFKTNSKDVETLVLLAQAFGDLGQTPKTVSVLRELAKVYVEQGQAEQAESTWRRVLTMAPDDEDARRALGMLPAAPPRASSGFEDEVQPSFVGAFPTNTSMVASRPAVIGSSGEFSLPRGMVPPGPVGPPPGEVTAFTGTSSLRGTSSANTAVNVPNPHGSPPVASLPPVGLAQPAAMSRPSPRSVPDLSPPPPAAPEPSVPEQVEKLFNEAEVFARYGRREKAIKHFQQIFLLDPDHLDARERYKALLVRKGEVPAAADELVACFRIALSRGDRDTARRYLADLASVSPLHAQLGVLRGELDGTPTVAPVAITVTRREGVKPPAAAASIEVDSGNSAGEQEVALLVEPPAEGEVEVPPPEEGFYDPALGDGAAAPESGALLGDVGPGLELPPDDGLPPQDEYPGDMLDEAALAAAGGDEALPATLEPLEEPPETPALLDDGLPAEGSAGPASDEVGADDLRLSTGALDAAFVAASVEDESAAPPPEEWAEEPPAADEGSGATEAVDVSAHAAAVPAPVVAVPPKRAAKPKPVAPKDMAEEFFPDELAEAEFFLQQGLTDEAKELLQTILDDVPDSWRAAWMLARAEAQEAGDPEPPHPYAAGDDDDAAGEEAPANGESPSDDGMASVAADLEEELSNVIPVPAGEEPVQISAEAVLAAFKEGVDRQISQDDADARHDLGIAYKEMGLLEDAIAEFEKSAGGPHKEADAYYLIGLCRGDQGQAKDAAAAFKRALQAAALTDSQRVAIQYELGLALLACEDKPRALAAFKQAHAQEPGFKDVASRVATLEKDAGAAPKFPGNGSTPPSTPPPPAGAPKKGKNIGYI